MNRLETIDRFLDAFLASDADAALALVTEDFTLAAMPMAPHVLEGSESLRQVLSDPAMTFPRPPEANEHETIRSVSEGDLVMHERVDRFQFDGKWHELPIAAIFEFRGDLICAETDYFDMARFMQIRQAAVKD